MKIYVSAVTDAKAKAARFVARVQEIGGTITRDWSSGNGPKEIEAWRAKRGTMLVSRAYSQQMLDRHGIETVALAPRL